MTHALYSVDEVLDVAREGREDFTRLTAGSGKKIASRIFYIGPRRGRNSRTLKADATAAKVGIYEVTEMPTGWKKSVLLGYL